MKNQKKYQKKLEIYLIYIRVRYILYQIKIKNIRLDIAKQEKNMNKLQKILKKRGISQVQLAENAGVTKATVNFLIKHGIKKISTAKKYAAALGVDWQELID